MPPELQRILDDLDAADRDAQSLTAGLSEQLGTTPPAPGAWSVSECLDHLATSNRVYLAPIADAAATARRKGRIRRGPALPGFVGGLFVRSLEPPPRRKRKNPKQSTPRQAPALADSLAGFLESNDAFRAFIRANADLDLGSIRFVNPFVRGIRFSLATGLHVITAHNRRHLWQARNAKQIVAPAT